MLREIKRSLLERKNWLRPKNNLFNRKQVKLKFKRMRFLKRLMKSNKELTMQTNSSNKQKKKLTA